MNNGVSFHKNWSNSTVSREIKCNNFAEVDLLSSLWDTVLIATQKTKELIQHSWHSFVNCSS